MPARATLSLLTLISACLLVGCPSNSSSSAPSEPGANTGSGSGGAPSAAAKQEAETIFSSRCVTCHGAQGAGDGTASAGLTPRPRNLRDAAWQASVTDEHIANIIKGGGAAVGKSPAMPPNPDLMDKADVVAALVAHIRGLKQ